RVLAPATLARRLAALPGVRLQAARPHRQWLEGIGCRTLGALRALPRAGLQRRCGPALVQALDRAYGQAPELFDWFQPPLSFSARGEPLERLEHATAVLALAGHLLEQMAGWLAARRRAVSRIELTLEHERGRHARAPTELAIALADPTWHADHLLSLLRERLAQLTLPAPVAAIALRAREVVVPAEASGTLFVDPGQAAADHRRLLELLEARLGADRVLAPATQADHLPEVANAWAPATRPARRAPALPRFEDRPLWLLEQPLPLEVRGHRPFHGTPLRLLRGPERLEVGWWRDDPQRRDYFIAEGEDSARYWIYQQRAQDDVRWFLHGLFG
ncbi:DNA polymerase Y family protein, partial [Pigmentiphaga soli]|uniref:Y-family DNA polymerase n=1 Tax=Pigmentiphaga soli TaxID=1007095 RepID=UPI0031F179B0